MADYIAGTILALALFFALRHVYRNFREGKDDCAACGGHCSGCSGRGGDRLHS